MTSNCLPKTEVNWKPYYSSENIQLKYRNGICTILVMKSGKQHMTEGIELPNQKKSEHSK